MRVFASGAALLALSAALTPTTSAQSISRLSGEYVCVYGCRLTDADPSIAVTGSEADCVNEYGGLYRGEFLGSDAVACFRKTGRLSADGIMLTWSDGVVWKRHAPASN